MPIDTYPHLFPKSYLKAVNQTFPNASVDMHLSEPRFYDPEFRVKMMDKYHIDMQMINVAGGMPIHEASSLKAKAARESPQLSRLANDEIAKMVETFPERFVGIGMLPMSSIDDAVQELDRCVGDLGLKGVCLWANDIPLPSNSKALDPIYEKMTRLELPIMIHPSFGAYVREPGEFGVGYTLGWPFETGMAMARLAFGLVLERFPKIKFLTHHSGSIIPYFAQRVGSYHQSNAEGSRRPIDHYYGKLPRNPVEYLKLFYNDTVVSGSTPSLLLARSFFGTSRLLLGTDYPYGTVHGEGSFQFTLKSIEDMGLNEEEKHAILEGNARKLFKLD